MENVMLRIDTYYVDCENKVNRIWGITVDFELAMYMYHKHVQT